LPGKGLNGRPRLVGAPSVIVDLSSGRVREVEGPLRAYRDTDPALPQYLVRGPGAVILDGRTAEKIRPSKAQVQAALKTAPRWRTPDGRAVLRSGKGFSIAGGARIDLGRWATSHGWPCGLGLRAGGLYVDFSRGRAYPRRGSDLRGFFALIRPGRWLIHRYHGGGVEWGLFDPDTGARAPAQGLSRKDQFVVLHDDGRVFLRRGKRTLLVDPESGAFRDCGRAVVFGAVVPDRFPGPVRTPGGARVYVQQTETHTVLARFDDKTETFHAARAVRSAMLIALLDEERALVLAKGRTVARVRFDSDEYEVLFSLD